MAGNPDADGDSRQSEIAALLSVEKSCDCQICALLCDGQKYVAQ